MEATDPGSGRYRREFQAIGHAPVCEPWERHPETGKRWQDMSGNDEVLKKLNFFLHRRGLLVSPKRQRLA